MNVSEALKSRVSTRAYAEQSPSLSTVREILDCARWTPSGGNIQPWKVIAVAGAQRDDVCKMARRALIANPAGEDGDYPVQPARLDALFRERRMFVASQRYAVMGIRRHDHAARAAAIARNFDFWGAPIGMFFVISRNLGHCQWAHLGMFIQSVVLAAEEKGLGACVQEAWAKVRESLGRHFGLPSDEVIYCGMALGYADATQPINALRSPREPIDNFARFLGFADEIRSQPDPGGGR